MFVEKYLEQTDLVLSPSSTSLGSGHVRAELHNVVVHCIEQTYWATSMDLQGNRHDPLELASRLLLETHKALAAKLSDASRLYCFAKIRYAFGTFTDFLYAQLFNTKSDGTSARYDFYK